MSEKPRLQIASHAVAAFRPGDRLLIRDPRGRSAAPAIAHVRDGGRTRLIAQGDFIIRYDYLVTRRQGVDFVDATGDTNPIHREKGIVAGALTAAKVIFPLEVLLPNFQIASARIKFTSFSTYGNRTRSTFWCRFEGEDKFAVTARAWQGEDMISEARVGGRVLESLPKPERVRSWRVNRTRLATVCRFCHSLGIGSRVYFEREGCKDYTYPFAYIASLPSGAIVREFEGQGGMLNIISLEVNDQPKIPIVGDKHPEVRVTRVGARAKSRFNRILTDVVDGVATYCRGSAMVNPVAEIG